MKLIFVFCNLQIFAYRGVFKIQKLKFFIKCLKSLEKEERERERLLTFQTQPLLVFWYIFVVVHAVYTILCCA